jgi:hypothetical protein
MDPFAKAWMSQALKPATPSPFVGNSGQPLMQAGGMMGQGPPPAGPAPNPNDPTAPVAVTPQQGTPSDAQHPILGALRSMFSQGGGQPQGGGVQLGVGGQGGNMDKVMGIMKMLGLGA